MNGVLPAALLSRCPRCGKGPLYDGWLHLAPACRACSLDYAPFDAGDGPAVFVILIVGTLVCGGALFVEFTYEPPFWVHALLWIPAVAGLSFTLLRFVKSLLLALQFRHTAGEGRPSG